MKNKLSVYCVMQLILTGCDDAGYAIVGVGQAISTIAAIDDAADAYEEQVIEDLCTEDPGSTFCPGHCDVDPEGIGCPGFKSFCDLFPDTESCT